MCVLHLRKQQSVLRDWGIVFIKLEKQSVLIQLILQTVPGKGRTFLVKYVGLYGNTISSQILLNAFTSI